MGYYPKTANSIRLIRNNSNSNPNYAELTFYINNKYYGVDNDTTFLLHEFINGKHTYILPKTWYSHYDGITNDSVLIEGTFNEP